MIRMKVIRKRIADNNMEISVVHFTNKVVSAGIFTESIVNSYVKKDGWLSCIQFLSLLGNSFPTECFLETCTRKGVPTLGLTFIKSCVVYCVTPTGTTLMRF